MFTPHRFDTRTAYLAYTNNIEHRYQTRDLNEIV